MKSLGVRLALLYAFVSTATLAVLFVAGYYLLNQHLIHGLDVLNEAEFEQIKAGLGTDYAALTRDKIDERIRHTTEAASVLFYIDVMNRAKAPSSPRPTSAAARFPMCPAAASSTSSSTASASCAWASSSSARRT